MEFTILTTILFATAALIIPALAAPMPTVQTRTGSGIDFLGATSLTPVGVSTPPALPTLDTRTDSDPDFLGTGHQSCTARDRGLVVNYADHIGAPFDQGNCNDAIDLLKHNAGPVSSARCYDGEGATWLKFNNLPGYGDQINKMLGMAWPEVDPFNCPNY